MLTLCVENNFIFPYYFKHLDASYKRINFLQFENGVLKEKRISVFTIGAPSILLMIHCCAVITSFKIHSLALPQTDEL